MRKTTKLRNILAICLIGCALTPIGCDKPKINPPKEYSQAYTGNDIVYEKKFWSSPEILDYKSVTGQEDNLSERNLRAIFFRGADYEGKETRVFAYLATPQGASKEKKVPGVVLVHGGGGTAYKEWAKAWTDRGYAALAIDYQGNMPLENCGIDTSKYVEIPNFTAPKNTSFADSEKPIKEQWMYWATSAVILGNSLLREEPYVDANKVGIAGISWGSIITTIAIGYDDRFAFACPIYGGLYNSDSDTYFDKMFKDNPKAMIWEDIEPIKICKVPTLFIMWNRDTNFSISSVSRTCTAHQNAQISIKSNWYHSHGGGMTAVESYAFANGICGKGRPFLKIKEQGNSLKLELPKGATAESIKLISTKDTLINSETNWETKKITTLEDIYSTAPKGWEYFYIDILDNKGWTISSTLFCKK